MPDLRELYQQLILDHGKSPRNLRKIEEISHEASGFNPVCGDKVRLYLLCRDDVVVDASFEGSGCAISTASASMLTQSVIGKGLDEIRDLRRRVGEMLTASPGEYEGIDAMGKLAAFSGVCEFPNRVKCATLAWHTLDAALGGREKSVSTEQENV